MLDILKLDDDVVIEADTNSRSGYEPFATGVYDFKIALAYIDYADSKAMSINLILKTADERELRITEYITGGEAKGCKPYYIGSKGKNAGKKVPLPGYSKMNALMRLVTGKTIDQLELADREVLVYDKTAGAAVPKSRKTFIDLIGERVSAGVLHTREDQKSKESGYKESTGETRDLNEIADWYQPDTYLTLADLTAGATEPAHKDKWLLKNEGKINDKSNASANAAILASAPKSGVPAGVAAGGSIFSKPKA